MSRPASPARQFYLQREGQDAGPFTVVQLNQMHSRKEVTASDRCRPADSMDYLPLGTLFPHMATFARKSREEHRQNARILEGNWQTNAALACAIGSWMIGGLVLGAFAIVLGVKAWQRVKNPMAVVAILIGGPAFLISAVQIMRAFLLP